MNKVILVASGKGGTGKTMFAVNLGAMLAQEGRRVALIDMDLGMRNMDLYLGMENRVVFNIMDVMSGMCRLNKALLRVSGFDSLYFMAANPRKDERRITSAHMNRFCEILRKYFDHIIIDCGAGVGDAMDAAIPAADLAVIVTEPEIASLRDADTLVAYLSDRDLRHTCMVINKVDVDLIRAGVLPDVTTIVNGTSTPVAGIIQMDSNIRVSTCRGIPIVCKPDTYIEQNFKDIARRVVNMA